MPETIDVEATTTPETEPMKQQSQTMALETRQAGAVGRAMTINELHERLEFVRNVMRNEMKEGQDFGKIPGTGEKPTLLQPGAQKLLMTFNLREQVKKEVLREFPGMPMHREYEFTVTVFPSGMNPGEGWDGVGTCSTLESKYRYRKAERRCPKCRKATLIAEKPEYVKGREPGFVCWKKKGGCGEIFHAQHPDIISQPSEDIENPDPADCWNTVRKMGFKRALVAAAINATNTSELWTQDLEDMAAGGGEGSRSNSQKRETAANASRSSRSAAPATNRPAAGSKPAATSTQTGGAPAKTPAQPQFASDKTREWLIGLLEKDGLRDLAEEFCQKTQNPAWLMPNERLEDLPLQFVPISGQQYRQLKATLIDFGNGGDLVVPYPPNEISQVEKTKQAAKAKVQKGEKPPAPSVQAAMRKDEGWFWNVICPIPNKGQKKQDYDKAPETILSLYTRMKSGEEAARKRLWGFARNWNPEPHEYNGKLYQPSEAETVFRQALDAFCDWEDKHGKDTKGTPVSPEPATEIGKSVQEQAAPEPQEDPYREEDDIPF